MLRRRTFDAIAAATRASRPSHRSLATSSIVASSAAPAVATAARASERRGRHHRRSSPAMYPFAVVGAAAAAAATGYIAAVTEEPARADASNPPHRKRPAVGSLPYDRAQHVADWLATKGASLTAVDVLPVDAGTAHVEEHGMGLYASKRSSPSPDQAPASSSRGFFGSSASSGSSSAVTLASVPLAMALTSKACAEHEAVGECFRHLMDDGSIDERMAVMLLLILEKRRGERSPAAPYVASIPVTFHTPLHYGADELKGLRGTNLHAATLKQRAQLDHVLKDSVRPAGVKLFRALRSYEKRRRSWFGRHFIGGETSSSKISESEFRWAYSAYWSRALSLPISADPRSPGIEAIIPGIDFANHSCVAPNARWEVRGVRGGRPDPSDGEPRVELLGEANGAAAPGEEVLISYGDKSNEELLFVHGFAERDNPHDALVLQPAWVTAGGDDDLIAGESSAERELRIEADKSRDALRKFKGLPSQIVLPAVPPARGLAGLDEQTVSTLEVWGLEPKALEYELHVEVAIRLAGLTEKDAREDAERTVGRSNPTVAERREGAVRALKLALDAQRARLEEATGFGAPVAGGDGSSGHQPKPGSRAAIAAAVKAASERRVDEVVAADPLAPPVVKMAAVYRSGVARMTRSYVNEAARWR